MSTTLPMPDPYEILHVPKDAPTRWIQLAFRDLARKCDPTTNPAPDAAERWEALVWAYQLLMDPIGRKTFDDASRQYAPSSRSAPPAAPAPPRASAPPPAPAPPPTSAPAPPRTAPPRTGLSRVLIIGLALLLGVLAGHILTATGVLPPIGILKAVAPRTASVATQPPLDPFADCIPWTGAGLYDGQMKCIYGRIILVTHETEPDAQRTLWIAYFGMNSQRAFRLVAYNQDLRAWEGQCIKVYGRLFDRDTIRDIVEDPPPHMVDTDPDADSSFIITAAPENMCQPTPSITW